MSGRRLFASMVGTFGGCAGVSAVFAEEATHYRRYGGGQEYPDFSQHHSYLADVLSIDMYDDMRNKRTFKGFRFEDAIQPGVDVPGSPSTYPIGVVAGDEESFFTFQRLYDPIIRARHACPNHKRHETNLNAYDIKGGRLDPQYVVNTRVRVSRNIAEHRFAPCIRRGERREVEYAVCRALRMMSSPYLGQYHRLADMSTKDIEDLVSYGQGFTKPKSPILLTAGYARDWPDARGIYINKTQDATVWVNESDHLRVIVSEKGGDLRTAFNKVSMMLLEIETALNDVGKTYAYNHTYGFLSPSLANIGTALRVTLDCKLPLVSKHPEFKKFLIRHDLATNSDGVSGVVDISNIRRLGSTEVQLAQHMIDVVGRLVAYEQAMEKGQKFKNL